MADHKQYISQPLDDGSVMISEDVIATVVAHAAIEVEGVAGLSVKPGADIADKLGKKTWATGIKITIGNHGELIIDCNINILYGQSVVAIAKAVQEAATAAVESFTNVKVSAINVNVCGIVRK